MIPAPSGTNPANWQQRVTLDVNRALSGYPFQSLSAAPTSVEAGFTYFDTTLATVRTWTGAAWANHF